MMLLLLLFLMPIASSLLLSVFNKRLKIIACFLSLIPLFLLVYFPVEAWIHDEFKIDWFPMLGIVFHLKMDFLSLLFIYLTAIIIPIVIFSTEKELEYSPQFFYRLVFLLEALLFAFFMARDLVVFTVFWEAMLIPVYFIISIWGKAKSKKAAMTFIISMIAGSSLLIVAVLGLYLASSTFNMEKLSIMASSSPHAVWMFAIFILAFSVKTPLFPFHGWLPITYYQASTSGTILLSSLLSKAGIYGFLRIGLGIFPELMREWSPLLLGLSIAGVLYGGMAAWMQSDYKRLIAYSSLSHVNFILAGIFVWNQAAHEGAILQAINHGIIIAGLFLVAGWLEERVDSTAMGPYHGLVKYFPNLCWLTLIFVLASVALPGTNSFIGELLILFGVFYHDPIGSFLLGLTVIISVIYMLRWMQHVYFGRPFISYEKKMNDIRFKQLLIASPLIALILWIGIYPKPLLQMVVPAAQIFGAGEIS